MLCWGGSQQGQVGQGNGESWGNQAGEYPSVLAPVQLGGAAVQLAVGYQHNCALLEGGEVRCWGTSAGGQLGYGDEDPVGLFDLPSERGPVQLGGPVRAIATGGAHSCAVFEDEGLICWGDNSFGQLGYGFEYDIGDDELPEVVGRVDLL